MADRNLLEEEIRDQSEGAVVQEAPLPVPRLKRTLDIVGSIVGIIVFSPVFLLAALLIRLDSAGPVFFSQTRVGRGRVPFTMYKFRTMRHGNDDGVHQEYVSQLIQGGGTDLRNENGTYKLEADDRVTRVGRLLRSSSVDELPQLFNVLRGEMSLVGPRPPLPYEVELYTPRHAGRLRVQPGITGLWQVSGRNETTFEEMVDLDLAYIRGYSPRLDAWILLRTVSAVIATRGA